MSTVLYIAHTESDGTLAKVSLETLTVAKDLAAGMGVDLPLAWWCGRGCCR